MSAWFLPFGQCTRSQVMANHGNPQASQSRSLLEQCKRWPTRPKNWFATLAVLLLLAPAALHAVEPNERLTNPVLEARARTISAELRCLVCQNESIDESGADLAHDIRILVRQRLTAGDSNAQAIQAVVNRYGSFVLLKPPLEAATYVLWYGPPLLVVVGLGGTLLWMRRRHSLPAEALPLSAEESRRLDGLIRGNDA